MKFEDYDRLRRKYNLPPWDEVDRYFFLRFIELPKEYPLRGIVKAIDKVISRIRGELELILFPREELAILYELNAFKDFDVNLLTRLYKEANYIFRLIDLYLLDLYNDDLAVKIINEALRFMKENYNIIQEIFRRKAEVWRQEFKLKRSREYYL